MSVGDVPTLTLTSSGFDAYLILVSPSGFWFAVDDNSGGGTNARIRLPVNQSGTWSAYVTGSPTMTTPPTGSFEALPDDPDVQVPGCSATIISFP